VCEEVRLWRRLRRSAVGVAAAQRADEIGDAEEDVPDEGERSRFGHDPLLLGVESRVAVAHLDDGVPGRRLGGRQLVRLVGGRRAEAAGHLGEDVGVDRLGGALMRQVADGAADLRDLVGLGLVALPSQLLLGLLPAVHGDFVDHERLRRVRPVQGHPRRGPVAEAREAVRLGPHLLHRREEDVARHVRLATPQRRGLPKHK